MLTVITPQASQIPLPSTRTIFTTPITTGICCTIFLNGLQLNSPPAAPGPRQCGMFNGPRRHCQGITEGHEATKSHRSKSRLYCHPQRKSRS